MRNNREYQICKDIAIYMRLQYPNVIFHFDLAGLNLSRAQAGMMKSIQGGRGWPDLFIVEPKEPFHGLFIEIKVEDQKTTKKDGTYITPHIEEQANMLQRLRGRLYKTSFGIGFDDCKKIIDDYLKR
jgi:hypothetical protein